MPFGRNVTRQVLHRHPGHGAIIRSFSDGQHTAGSADLRGSVGATCGSSRQGFVRPGKVAVLGAGAIGAYVGAALHRGGGGTLAALLAAVVRFLVNQT